MVDNENKTALVLSGGGVKGAFQLGVIENLLNTGKNYDIITGISVGALNGSILATAGPSQDDLKKKFDDLKNIWNKIKRNSDIYRNWFYLPLIGHLWGLFFGNSLYNSKPLQDKITKNLAGKKFLRKLIIGTVAYGSGEYREITDINTEVPDINKWVIASSAFPFFLTPMRINKGKNDDLWFDGGVRTFTPLNAAINAGATNIDVILTSPDKPSILNPKENFTGTRITSTKVALRSLDLMSNEILLRDLKFANTINQWIQNGVNIPNKKLLDVTVYAPKEHFIWKNGKSLNSLEFNQKIIQWLFNQGKSIKGVSLNEFLS